MLPWSGTREAFSTTRRHAEDRLVVGLVVPPCCCAQEHVRRLSSRPSPVFRSLLVEAIPPNWSLYCRRPFDGGCTARNRLMLANLASCCAEGQLTYVLACC